MSAATRVRVACELCILWANGFREYVTYGSHAGAMADAERMRLDDRDDVARWSLTEVHR